MRSIRPLRYQNHGSRFRHAHVLRIPQQTYTSIKACKVLRNFGRAVGRAIVKNQQFPVFIGLRKHGRNRFLNIFFCIVRRHDDRNERCRSYSVNFSFSFIHTSSPASVCTSANPYTRGQAYGYRFRGTLHIHFQSIQDTVYVSAALSGILN